MAKNLKFNMTIKKWAIYSRKKSKQVGREGGRGEDMEFQGYQTNRMWNFQELIKNDMECNLFQW